MGKSRSHAGLGSHHMGDRINEHSNHKQQNELTMNEFEAFRRAKSRVYHEDIDS